MKLMLTTLNTTTNNTNCTTNNTNCTTNTTNNYTTINQFKKEDVTWIVHEVVRDLIKGDSDLYASLQTMVRLIHFNPQHPQNMNVYVPDPESDQGWRLDKAPDKWRPYPLSQLAQEVIQNGVSYMREHEDEPYDREYTKKEHKRFDEFYQNVDNEQRPLKETIDTMINHKDLVEKCHPHLPETLSNKKLL